MSFFCLTEFLYEIKGAIKKHFRRFTAVIHNFLPTLSSQLTELSFQSKYKITRRKVSFLERVIILVKVIILVTTWRYVYNIYNISFTLKPFTGHWGFPAGAQGALLFPISCSPVVSVCLILPHSKTRAIWGSFTSHPSCCSPLLHKDPNLLWLWLVSHVPRHKGLNILWDQTKAHPESKMRVK